MRAGILNTTNVLLENVSYAVYGIPVDETGAYAVIDVNICNRGYETANVQLFISDGVNEYPIESNVSITGSNVYLITSLAISAGDLLYVKSDQANLSVNIYGGQFRYDGTIDLPLPSIDPEDSITGPSPLANDRFGDTIYANDSFYLVSSAQGVYLYSTVDDSLLNTFTNPGDVANGFGDSVAASDFFVFIGAPDQTTGVVNGNGAVYVYSSINYELAQTLINVSAQDFYGRFGSSLEANNDYLLVGDTGGGVTTQSGSILVYGTTARNYLGALTSANLPVNSELGTNVSLNNSFVVAGVPSQNTVITFSASSLTLGTEIEPGFTTSFGLAVDTKGGIIVVGDPEAEVNSLSDAGRAFVYDDSGNLLFELNPPSTLVAGDRFGEAIGLGSEFIFVGAPGTNSDEGIVYSYTYEGSFVATVTI